MRAENSRSSNVSSSKSSNRNEYTNEDGNNRASEIGNEGCTNDRDSSSGGGARES